MAEATRTQDLRFEWRDGLWAFLLSSHKVGNVAAANTYLVTPFPRSIHVPLPPGSIQVPTLAYAFGDEVLVAAAGFFKEHPSAQWVILTVTSLGLGKARVTSVNLGIWQAPEPMLDEG